MARRRAGQARVRMGDRMQSQDHGGSEEGRRAWSAGYELGRLEMWTLEGGGWGRAEGKHGVADGHGDTVGQEVAGKGPEVEDGQQGRGRGGDERREHGPPDGGAGISSSSGRYGGVRDRRQMQALRPGSKAKADGASQSDCPTLGDT